MSTRKKVVLWLFIIIILAIASFVVYIWFSESKTRDPFTAIPDDAIYIIETSNLTKGWSTLSDSKMWKHLMDNKHFTDISKKASTLDSLIKGNSTMDMLFSDRQLLLSAHMISGKDYDFIFVVNMKQASKILFVKDYIKSIIGAFGYTMSKRDFEGTEIIELTDDKTLQVLYITFIDNLFVGSYSPVLLEKSIKQKDKNNWANNHEFHAATDEISSHKLFNFYFNYSQLSKYMNVYLSEESDMVNSLSHSIKYSAFNVSFEGEKLTLSGYTSLADSVSSYLKALVSLSPGKAKGYKIVSDKTALYLAMCFDNFDDFYKNITAEFSNEKKQDAEDYTSTIKKVEKLFRIDLQEDFLSWIGHEIAFVKLKPVANAKEGDVCILIQAKDIDDAKKNMDHLAAQVKKRSPLKFETVDYKDYKINYLDIKGFFRMFFGKLFGKLTKPYFTYIDDYVLFSNSPSTLMHMIDDYTNGKTLEKDKEFSSFKDNFESKSNVTAFVRMPEMYSHLYYYSNTEQRKSIHENKDLILSFSQVGFQLISDGKMFKTSLVVSHDEDVLFNQELEKFDNAAEELYLSEFDSLKFKLNDVSKHIHEKDGAFHYRDSTKKIKYEGILKDGRIDGLLKSYYENGNLAGAVNYRDGKVVAAKFYYDNDEQKVKAEMVFDDDEKIKGEYLEYYENGAKKAVLEFDNGKPNGDALFYYDSGKIKIVGSYKDGKKTGNWKNYTEDGNLFDKEKWAKGQSKKKTNDGE
jgi:antitoxin component YwqK of YwqJK toxin-antitoxin module